MELISIQNTSVATSPAFEKLDDAVRHFLSSQHSANSKRAYISDCKQFAKWCSANDVVALPSLPETLARYFSDEAQKGIAARTIVRRRAAIKWMHESANLPSPTSHPIIKQVMKGIVREVGNGFKDQKDPIVADQLAQMIGRIDTGTIAGQRDMALLLIGFSGAFRRSELSQIRVEHLRYQNSGVSIYLSKSKTDQTGEGRWVPVLNGSRFKPVEALKRYIESAGITSGYVFRSLNRNGNVRDCAIYPGRIAMIIKNYAQLAGMDPSTVSGHSLRAGFVTTGVMHDANIFKLMEVTGHKEVKTLKGYARIAEQFKNHAGSSFL